MRRLYRVLKLTERLCAALAGWFDEFGPEMDKERKDKKETREDDDVDDVDEAPHRGRVKDAQFTEHGI